MHASVSFCFLMCCHLCNVHWVSYILYDISCVTLLLIMYDKVFDAGLKKVGHEFNL